MRTSYKDFVRGYLFKNVLSRQLLILSMSVVAVLPVFNYLVVSPSLNRFLAVSTNDAAVRVARHFVSMFNLKKAPLNKNTIRFRDPTEVHKLKSDFKLTKFKLISKSGEVLFSSDPEEIGSINNENYFHRIVAKGNVVANDIEKGTESLEGEIIAVDVVETYVPLIKGDHFHGAFEIYYDITDGKQHLDKFLTLTSCLALILALGLLSAILVMLLKANRTYLKSVHLEKMRDKLSAERHRTGLKIPVLKGVLPICSNCKKIRDARGSWKHVESYIAEHSEAEFTHSICPECAKKLYPDL